MKSSNFALIILALTIAIVAIGATSNVVSADSCTGQLGYPAMPTVYLNSNVPIVVPVPAICTTYYRNQLYVTGSADDVNSGATIGSVTCLHRPMNGSVFNGQLYVNLPASTQGNSVQISASLYDGQYGGLTTTISETIKITTGTQVTTTTTITQQAQATSTIRIPTPARQHRTQSQNQTQNSSNTSILDYVVIVAILGAVIITTAGLVMYGRRQPQYPIQCNLPRHAEPQRSMSETPKPQTSELMSCLELARHLTLSHHTFLTANYGNNE